MGILETIRSWFVKKQNEGNNKNTNEYYSKNRERILEYSREYYKKNKEKINAGRTERRRIKNSGLKVDSEA